MKNTAAAGVAAIVPSAESTLLELAERAIAAGMHLLTDGRRAVLSARPLPGWKRLAVRVKGGE